MEQNKQLFIHTAMQHMGALKNWPDAGVPVTSLVTEYIPEICQVPYDYLFCKDPVGMCECTLLVWEYLGLDILTGNMDCYNIEGEAMGAHMRYYPDHCPDFDRSDPFIKTKEDIEKIKFGGLDTGRFRYLIRYHQAYKQYTGLDSFPVFSAPWTLAGNLYGIEKLVMDTINDPDFVCEYRLSYMQLIVEKLHPDCIVSHDDWGSKTSLFFSADVWREFFKEPYRKLYDYLHENNVIVMHHSDSYCEPLAGDMAEIGIDIWQGVLPTNNLAAISEKVGDRMLLMGGVDSVIDREDASEEEIRNETRRACNEYGSLRGFWPGYTYGGGFPIYPHVGEFIIDEINRYNMEHFGMAPM